MGAVVANELMDREKQRKWICMIEKRAGKQTLTEVQIETKDGPLSYESRRVRLRAAGAN